LLKKSLFNTGDLGSKQHERSEKVSRLAMDLEHGVLGSIFVPDVITPQQYYDSRHDDSAIAPVKRLMMAVLEDALRCFQNNSDANSGPRKRLFAEAEQWLCGEAGDGPFSFDTVCETLGIEPNFFTGRSQRLAQSATRRGFESAPGTSVPGCSEWQDQREHAARFPPAP